MIEVMSTSEISQGTRALAIADLTDEPVTTMTTKEKASTVTAATLSLDTLRR
jgi:hypothetical protein